MSYDTQPRPARRRAAPLPLAVGNLRARLGCDPLTRRHSGWRLARTASDQRRATGWSAEYSRRTLPVLGTCHLPDLVPGFKSAGAATASRNALSANGLALDGRATERPAAPTSARALRCSMRRLASLRDRLSGWPLVSV